MQKMVDLMIQHTGLDRDSFFLDVGSGIGKPNFHVANDPCVQVSFGLEVDPDRWLLSINCLLATLEFAADIVLSKPNDTSLREQLAKQKCIFIQGDIKNASVFDPFTHVYMFSIGFPPTLWVELARIWNKSASPYLICFHAPKDIVEKYKFDVEFLAQTKTTMHGSKEGHTGYVYRRKNQAIQSAKKTSTTIDPVFAEGIEIVRGGFDCIKKWAEKMTVEKLHSGPHTRTRQRLGTGQSESTAGQGQHKRPIAEHQKPSSDGNFNHAQTPPQIAETERPAPTPSRMEWQDRIPKRPRYGSDAGGSNNRYPSAHKNGDGGGSGWRRSDGGGGRSGDGGGSGWRRSDGGGGRRPTSDWGKYTAGSRNVHCGQRGRSYRSAVDNQRGRDHARQQPHANSRNCSNAHSGHPESSAGKSIHDTNGNKFCPAHQQHSETRAKDDAATAKTNDDATSLLAGSDKNVEKEDNLAAHEHPTSVRSVPVSEEDWNQLSVGNKMVLLLPDEDVKWSQLVAEFPRSWQKRVEEAVTRILKKTREKWDDDQKSKNTGSDEIEDEYDSGYEPDTPPNMSGTICTELPLLYTRFIEKLPQCTAMHFGFHVSSVISKEKKKICYCPCSKKMQTWRKQFVLEGIPQCNAKGRFLDPDNLRAHLKTSHRSGVVDFHHITLDFLNYVYK
jgi:uncharacterized membrane protein YgcG